MLAWTLEPTTTHCTIMGEYRVSLKNVFILFVWIALLVKMELVRPPVDSSLTNIIQNVIDNKFYVFSK